MQIAEALALFGATGAPRDAADEPPHPPLPAVAGFTGPEIAALLDILLRQPPGQTERRAAMVQRIRAALAPHIPAPSPHLDRVLAALARVPREAFLSDEARDVAYLPTALKIGHGQTISHPLVVAAMTTAAAIAPDAHILDVGTGSGYQAAILSVLARSVISLEVIAPLARSAARRLEALGFGNVTVLAGDGCVGAAGGAPYDAIIVAAGASKIPAILLDHLKPGGKLVMPIGPSQSEEQLIVASKGEDHSVRLCSLGRARFVPLTGIGDRAATRGATILAPLPYCYGTAITE